MEITRKEEQIMKMIIEIDPIEENDYAQVMANVLEISSGIFEIRHNMKKHFEWEIDSNRYKTQYDLIEDVLEYLLDLFPNIDVQ